MCFSLVFTGVHPHNYFCQALLYKLKKKYRKEKKNPKTKQFAIFFLLTPENKESSFLSSLHGWQQMKVKQTNSSQQTSVNKMCSN